MLFGCSGDEPKWTRLEMLALAKKGDPKLYIILPSNEKEVIRCSSFKPQCKIAFQAIVKGLKMICLFYDTTAEAELAAKHVRGYYSRNWAFDDVAGEPILERFVTKHLHGIKPKNYTITKEND